MNPPSVRSAGDEIFSDVDAVRTRPVDTSTGQEAALAVALSEIAPVEFSAAAPYGALEFRLLREENGLRWILEETWESRAAFDAFHAGHSPAVLRDFLARADDLLAEPIANAVSFWSHEYVSAPTLTGKSANGRRVKA